MAKPMNKQQVDHLRTRLTEAVGTAVAAFANKIKLPAPLSDAEKDKLIIAGKVKAIPKKLEQYITGRNVFAFPQDEAYTKARSSRDARVAEFKGKLSKKVDSIIDQAVLGDAASALAEMDKFIASIVK